MEYHVIQLNIDLQLVQESKNHGQRLVLNQGCKGYMVAQEIKLSNVFFLTCTCKIRSQSHICITEDSEYIYLSKH